MERCAGAGCTTFAQVGTPTGTSSATPASRRRRLQLSRARRRRREQPGPYSAIATATTAADTTPPTAPTGDRDGGRRHPDQPGWTALDRQRRRDGLPVERCPERAARTSPRSRRRAARPSATPASRPRRLPLSRARRRRGEQPEALLEHSHCDTTARRTRRHRARRGTLRRRGRRRHADRPELWTASTDNVGVTGYRVERCAGGRAARRSRRSATPTRHELQRHRP